MDTTKLIQVNSNYHDDVNKICFPLFQKTPIDFFVYEHFHDSGDAIFLSSSPDVLVNWAKDDLHPTREELDLYASFGLKTALLSHLIPLPPGTDLVANKYDKIISVACENELFHSLFIVDRLEASYRVCGFGVKKSNKSILNFYINAVPLLQKFINYFEKYAFEKVDININSQELIFLPTYHVIQPMAVDIDNLSDVLLGLDFTDSFDFKSTILNPALTSRESQCLSLVAQGYTMKSAAKKLEISHRTVEQHLRNIKEKLGLQTKSQLVEIWHAHQ